MTDPVVNARSITDSERTVREGEARAVRSEHRPTWAQRLAATVDEVVILRLTDGVPVEATSWERREAVRRLRLARLTYQQIAARLRVHERQVHRHLQQVGLVPAGVHGGTAPPSRDGADVAPDDPKGHHLSGPAAPAGTT